MIRVQCWLRTCEGEAGVSCYGWKETQIKTQIQRQQQTCRGKGEGEGGQRGFGWRSERRELENNIEVDDRLIPAESLYSIRVNCWGNIIISFVCFSHLGSSK